MITYFCLLFVLLFCSVNAIVNDRYYPRYHLAPPFGWMNDPNGFCIFKNEYHLFYQFNPNSSLVPGIAHWGHAKSPDLFHWTHLPIAMYPDTEYDKSGVFSGSALVEGKTMYIFYTGNVNLVNQAYEHVEVQALATSTDGVHVTKYRNNPIIGEEFQPNIRDPKVWKHGNTYYMVLGNSFQNNTLGRILLYKSKDKLNWKYVSILLESDGKLGYMFECPDLFELDGRFVLMFSPQGVKPSGDKFRNLYQTGYVIGNFDYETYQFTPITEFIELDNGHDLYASQSLLDKAGNRVIVAWFDMWENNYPEETDGFTGQMTIPRVLRLSWNNRIIQRPVSDISFARKEIMYGGIARAGNWILLDDKTADIEISASAFRNFELILESSNATHVSIKYDALNGKVTLDRGDPENSRRTSWRPRGLRLRWRVFVDASSIELFCGDGEVTFSSRFFPDGPVSARVGAGTAIALRVFSMKRTVIAPATI